MFKTARVTLRTGHVRLGPPVAMGEEPEGVANGDSMVARHRRCVEMCSKGPIHTYSFSLYGIPPPPTHTH